MNRETVIRMLAQTKPELQRRFGVTKLVLFGSIARNEARGDSDVDVLVAFDGPASAARYFGAQFYLEDLLHALVDLTTEKARGALIAMTSIGSGAHRRGSHARSSGGTGCSPRDSQADTRGNP